jgi:hypothetical protein
MAAFDPDAGSRDFVEDDEHLLGVFAAGAAAAIGQQGPPEQTA